MNTTKEDRLDTLCKLIDELGVKYEPQDSSMLDVWCYLYCGNNRESFLVRFCPNDTVDFLGMLQFSLPARKSQRPNMKDDHAKLVKLFGSETTDRIATLLVR